MVTEAIEVMNNGNRVLSVLYHRQPQLPAATGTKTVLTETENMIFLMSFTAIRLPLKEMATNG